MTRSARPLPSIWIVAVASCIGWWLGTLWNRPVLDQFLTDRLPAPGRPTPASLPHRLERVSKSRVVMVDVSKIPGGAGEVVDRRTQAQVVRQLTRMGAWAIGLDLVHEQPKESQTDEELRCAIRDSGRVVLATRYDVDAKAEVRSIFADAARLRGIASFVVDPKDGYLRKVQHYYEESGFESSHSFGLCVARLLVSPPPLAPAAVRLADDALLLEQQRERFVDVPIDALGLSLIQYQGPPATIPSLHAAELLALPQERLSLSGKAVLVGTARLEGSDQYLTPFHRSSMCRLSGVEIHAQDLLGIVTGTRYRFTGWPIEVGLALVAALAGALVGAGGGVARALGVLATGIVLGWMACANVFLATGLVVNALVLAMPACIACLSALLATGQAASSRIEATVARTPGADHEAAALDPVIDRALEILHSGRAGEALARLKVLVPADSSQAPDRVHWAMAVTLLTLRQPTLALPHMAAMNPRSLSLDDLYRLGRNLEDQGALPESIDIYRRIRARDHAFRDVAVRLGEAELRDRLVPGWLRKGLGDRYRELTLIGSGGMGRVYRAHDEERGHDVAIKVPDEAALAHPETRRRFLREAEALACLSHPHIVRIHDVHDSDPLYYTMELVAGCSLRELMPGGEPMEPRRAVLLMAQAASAIEAIHGAGMVHRDIKPGNILVNESDHVWLADFGLAHFDQLTRVTRTGATLGTPLYMAPEQIEGREPTPSWDLYALGVVLFEALAGDPPFGPDEVMMKMVRAPPSLGAKQPTLPADLVELVDSLMAVDRSQLRVGAGTVHAMLGHLGASWAS